MNEISRYNINNNLSKKLNLCFFATLLFQEKNDKIENKNPIYKLISSWEEILSILSLGETDVLKVLYFNRFATHEILYEAEEVINITNTQEEKLDYYQYLCLLIEENTSVVNYIYSFELIKKINEIQTKIKNEKIQKIIIAKIILVLINNYEQSENEEELNQEISDALDNLKTFNSKIIEDNKVELDKYNISIKDKPSPTLEITLEGIFNEIIKYLFVNKKLDDSEDTNNIIRQINFKYFNITKVIFDSILKLLRKENDYIKEYIINEYNDLFDLKKINFYYTLIKYILKSDFYIYEIPLLLETRKKIKKLIKENIAGFYQSMKQNRNYNDKIEYILKAFIEYKYYFEKSKRVYTINANANTSQQGSHSSAQVYISNKSNNYNYYGNPVVPSGSESSGFFSHSSYKNAKQDSGRHFEGYIEEPKNEFDELEKKFGGTIIFKILRNSSFKFEFKKNNNQILANCILIKIDGEEEKQKYDELIKNTCENNHLNNNFKMLIKFLDFFKNKIKTSFTNDFTFSVILNFSSNVVNLSVFQVDCIYQLEIPEEEITEYKDFDIFNIKEVNQNGFLSLINEINVNR